MYIGNGGYGWSLTVNSTFGMGLGFNAQPLHPSHTDYRGHGFQLRCLSEVRVALTIGSLYPIGLTQPQRNAVSLCPVFRSRIRNRQ
ncbi:hypothetical protein [uncultured Rikenella sp.]|uniref:hypothetical protein n=1 Tax=uncultured Rikenella sp. TaxID=368003 RepID=UPI0025F9533F|nr:hypothetical protein [uncultured Rikenella sp.]